MAEDGKHLVVDCSSTDGAARLLSDADEVPIAVRTIADAVEQRDRQELADWRARQAHAEATRQVELRQHGEAVQRQQEALARARAAGERNPDVKVVLEALGLV